MENKFFLINDNTINTISVSKKNNLEHLYFIYPNNDLNINLNYELDKYSFVNINVVVINYLNYQINLNINSLSNNSFNNFNIHVNAIGFDDSKTFISINSYIGKHGNENYVNQIINGLLLSSNSKITGEPILKINNNNISAKHSLHIGSINYDELFYLQTKGLNERMAKKILINALIDNITINYNEQINEKIKQEINERLK